MFKIIPKARVDLIRPGDFYILPNSRNTTGFGISYDGAYDYKIRDVGFDRGDVSSVAIHKAALQYNEEEFELVLFSGVEPELRRTNSVSPGHYTAVLLRGTTSVATYELALRSYSDLSNKTGEIIEQLLTNYNKNQKEAEQERIAEEELAKAKDTYYSDIGKTVKPQMVEIVEEEEIHLNVKGTSTQERFISIVGEVSDLTRQINENTALGDNKEVVDSFLKAKEEISKLTSTQNPGSTTGFIGKYFANNKYTKKLLRSAKEIKAANDSIQNNINHLFGVIHTKYEKLVLTGESLQKTKSLLVAQVSALEELLIESNAEIAQYAKQADIPMRELQLNTQIKASVEKYKGRLVKIDGAIMATQTTIIALGKDLPAMKTDLIDEMAIGSLLSNVDDYQQMFQEIANLVSGVAKSTAEQTHTVIENLLEMQINDTHTMQYLEDSAKRGEKFALMVSDKSQQLVKKVHRDAEFIGSIVKGNTIADTRKSIKLLKD